MAELIIYQVIWNDQTVTPDLSLSRKFAIIEILKTYNLPHKVGRENFHPSKLVLLGIDWLTNVMHYQVLIKTYCDLIMF